MKTHHKASKRVKLSTKYNLQKKVREHKRRLKKECKKMGLQKRVRKDPGIPNSWPFKAELLQEIEEKKEKRDADMEMRRKVAKNRASKNHKQAAIDKQESHRAREEDRKEKRADDVARFQLQNLRRNLSEADVLLQVLDVRDPLGCRCAALEAWAQENKKRIVFVLTKADLVTAETASKWLLTLGQIAPTVVVQAEAGREGIRELLVMLGHAPAKVGVGQVPAAAAVGVVGYAGTGKRALSKAMRQELKSTAPWLLEAAKLNAVEGTAPTASSALHSALRGNAARGAAGATSVAATLASGSGAGATEGVDPVDVVKELLSRVEQPALLRHFRIPAFDGVDALLKIFCEDRKITSKKNKAPTPAAIAQRILAELPAIPGCFCSPTEAALQGAQNFWGVHGGATSNMKLFMEEQVKLLSARGVSGPAATALAIASSQGFGPTVDIVGALTVREEAEAVIPGENDVSDSEAGGSDDDMSGSGMMEGEEEEVEGEESEEEMSDEE